jgi:hypothetical protein
MTPLDPAGWSWGRLAGASASWVLAVALTAAYLVARVISHAKQTDASGGDFIVRLPYGTRHLALAIALALLPPLLAFVRKLVSG